MRHLDLESKAWYRAIKIVYILLNVVAVGFILLVSYIFKPYTVNDYYKINVDCNKPTGYHFTFNVNYPLYSLDNSLNNDDDVLLKRMCNFQSGGDVTAFFTKAKQDGYTTQEVEDFMATHQIGNAPSYFMPGKNYTLSYVSSINGSWSTVLKILGIGIVVLYLLDLIIQKMFFYIVLGS